MLSAYGAAVIAYYGDGFVIHDHCAREKYGEHAVEHVERGLFNEPGLTPAIRYSLESDWPEGLTCDHCSLWIVEPDEYEDEED